MKRYEGLWRAKVVDNDDSGEEYPYYAAIKVRVPEIHGEKIPKKNLPWAYAMIPFGQGKDVDGFDYCSVNIPKVDTWLWVMFEHGDPNRPVYLGGWIGGEESELPDEFKEDGERSSAKYPDIKGYKFGFAKGSFTVRVVDDRRLEIKFDDDNIIEIDSKGDDPNEEKQICIRTDWLARIDSGKKIKLEAPEIELVASTKLILDGSLTEVGGAGRTVLKGSALVGQGTVTGTLAHPQ